MFGRALTWCILVEAAALAAVGAWACWKHFAAPSAVVADAGAKGPAAGERAPNTSARKEATSSPSGANRRRPMPHLRRPRVVVEKSARRLTLYDGAKLIKVYGAAVGANRGDKHREGDRRTPEGEFYVCVRKKAPSTSYVRSLGLSYPNIEDAARGLREKIINAAQHRRIVESTTTLTISRCRCLGYTTR